MAEEHSDEKAEAQPQPLRCIHTSNSPSILQQMRASLLVTTYQGGGPTLNVRGVEICDVAKPKRT